MKNFDVKINSFSVTSEKDFVVVSKLQDDNPPINANIWIKIMTGAIIGFINGFWGGGGGMICVPLLINILRLPEKKAHATTLLIMLPLSLASLIIYIFSGNLPIIKSINIGVGFIIGGIIGAIVLKFISNTWLGVVFSLIIIAGGLKLII